MIIMSESTNFSQQSGFLHLADLKQLQINESIFTIPDGKPDDILQQITKQNEGLDDGVAFDLRLGSQYYISGNDHPAKLDDGDYISIKPGQFALLTTYERFSMPLDYVAFISMRFKVKAAGLINVSGFQVDPGYQGVFIFSIYNAGPQIIPLQFKEEIFTVIFSKTTQKIKKKRSIITEIPVEKWEKLLQQKNISLIELDNKLNELKKSYELAKSLIPVIITSVGIVGGIIGYLLNR